MTILSLINGILMIYVSIAVGQLFNGHKLIGAFAAYIGISTVIQIAASLLIFAICLIYKDILEDINSIQTIVFPVTLLALAVLNVAFYWVTDYIFKNKLNLE